MKVKAQLITTLLGVMILTTTTLGQSYDPTKLYYNSGNFGLGTSTPQAFLHLNAANPLIRLTSTSAGQTIDNDGTNNGWAGLQFEAPLVKNGTPASRWTMFYSTRDKTLNLYDYSINQSLLTFYDGSQTVDVGGVLRVGPRGDQTTQRTAVIQAWQSTGANDGGNTMQANHLELRSGIGTGLGANGDIRLVTEGSIDNWGNGAPHGSGSVKMIVKSNGNVGVGTTSPQALLDVNGNFKTSAIGVGTQPDNFGPVFPSITLGSYGSGLYGTTGQPQLTFFSNAYISNGWKYKTSNFGVAVYSIESGAFLWYTAPSGAADSAISLVERMRILNNGNVGIGTQSPDFKLTVNGSIKCKEVIVTLNGFADFVFEKNYNLLPLEKVQSYILKNKHLPDFPSEKELISNGMSLSKMQVKLVQKVEELTLYSIQQSTKIKTLELKNASLEQRVVRLERSAHSKGKN